MKIIKSLTLCSALALGLGFVATSITSCGPSKEERKATEDITSLANRVEKEAANYTAEDWEKVYKEYDSFVAEGSEKWDSEEFQQANKKLFEAALAYGGDPSRFGAKNDVAGEPSADGGEVVEPSIDDVDISADGGEVSAEGGEVSAE